MNEEGNILSRGAFIRFLRRLPPNKPFIPITKTVCPVEWLTYVQGQEYNINRDKIMSLKSRQSSRTPTWVRNFVTRVDNLSSKGKIAWNQLTPKQCLEILKKG